MTEIKMKMPDYASIIGAPNKLIKAKLQLLFNLTSQIQEEDDLEDWIRYLKNEQ